jgi:hypothetical protein
MPPNDDASWLVVALGLLAGLAVLLAVMVGGRLRRNRRDRQP